MFYEGMEFFSISKKARGDIMQGWQKLALGTFIMIAFVGFVMLAMETFYKAPRYSDYFPRYPVAEQEIATQEQCEEHGGKWITDSPRDVRTVHGEYETRGEWCDLRYYANQEWEEARGAHDRNSAIILGIVSVVAFVAGIGLVKTLPMPVGGGLAFGGIVLSLISLGRYWDYTNEYVRLGIIGIILVFLIGLAYRYAKGDNPKKKVEEKGEETQEDSAESA